MIISGAPAKKVKCYINKKLIYPAEDTADVLISAHPMASDLSDSDKLFDQLFQLID